MGGIPTYTSKIAGAVDQMPASTVSAGAISQVDKMAVHFQNRQQEEDVVAVMNADMAMSEWQDGYQYDPDEGILVADKYKGLGAKGAYKNYKDAAEANYQTTLAGMTNENQKTLLKQNYTQMLDAGRDRFAKHEAVQTASFSKSSKEAFSAKQMNAAIGLAREGNDAGAMAALNSAIATRRQSMVGASPAEKDNAALAIRTSYHSEIFEGMVIDDPVGAQKYLKENKKQIDNAVLDNLQAKGKISGDKAKGNEIYTKAYDADASMESIYDKIEKGSGTSEQQVIAKSLAKDMRSVQNSDKAAAKREAELDEDKATDELSAMLRDTENPLRYDQLPPDVLERAGRVGRKSLLAESAAISKGILPKYNYSIEDNLNTMYLAQLRGESDEFLTHNMAQYNGSHDRSRVQHWKQLKAKMNTTDIKELTKQRKRGTHITAATKLMKAAVNGGTQNTEKKKKLSNKYSEQIINYVNDWHDSNPGQTMDSKKLNKFTYSLMLDGEYQNQGQFMGKGKDGTFSDATKAGYGNNFFVDNDKEQYETISKSTGIPIGKVGWAFTYLKDVRNQEPTLANMRLIAGEL